MVRAAQLGAVRRPPLHQMSRVTLSDDTYTEILRLMRVYAREAHKCRESKAFLAGCVMAGAALEATLLAVASCLPDDILASPAAPRRKEAIKPLIDWSLSELLAVAKERNWLPSGLSLHDQWNGARARIGDYAEVLRQIRNLIHPARYALDLPRKRVTKRYLESSFEIMDVANRHLKDRILQSLHSLADEPREDGAA